MSHIISQREIVLRRNAFLEPHELLPTSDGKRLFLRHWPSAAPSPVSVLILHGISAYSGAYSGFLGEPLARAGFDTWGLDLRGHGLSDGRRGDYPSPQRFETDLKEAAGFVRTRSRRLVVLGHSLGVLSALVTQRVAPEKVDGLVLLSAARHLNPGVFPPPSGADILKALLGVAFLHHSRLIEYRRTGQLGREDPLYNFRYSVKFYEAAYGTSFLVLSGMLREGSLDVPNLRPSPSLQVPVLVGVGDQDEIFPVEAVRSFYESLPTRRREFMVIPGGHHAHFPPQELKPLTDWLRRSFPTH